MKGLLLLAALCTPALGQLQLGAPPPKRPEPPLLEPLNAPSEFLQLPEPRIEGPEPSPLDPFHQPNRLAPGSPLPAGRAPSMPLMAPGHPGRMDGVKTPDERPVIEPAPEPESPHSSSLKFNNSPQARMDVLMVRVPLDTALPLVADLRDPARAKAAHENLQQLLSKRAADLIDWPEVTLHSGGRSVSEDIVEERYPVEFGNDGPRETSADVKPGAAKESEKSLVDADLTVPSVFETRNTGTTIETEVAVSPDMKSATIMLAPQFVRLLKMQPFKAGNDASGKPAMIEQPIFQTAKVNTTITLRDGERQLIFVGKPVTPDDNIILFTVGIHIIPPDSVIPRRKPGR